MAPGTTADITIPEVNQLFSLGWPFLLGTGRLTHWKGEAAHLSNPSLRIPSGPEDPTHFSSALQRERSNSYSSVMH